MSYNHQEIIGYLAADAVIREVSENRNVIALRVGSTSHYLSNGKQVSHTEWFNVECFCTEKQAAFFAKSAHKGALVHASGETRTKTWVGTDGQEHRKTAVLCSFDSLLVLKLPSPRDDAKPPVQDAPEPGRSRSRPPLPAASDDRMDLLDFED